MWPFVAQSLGQHFGLVAGAAIDNAGLTLAGGCKIEDLFARPVLGSKGQMDVRPVEPTQKLVWFDAVEQFLDNLILRLCIRRGGEGSKRNVQARAEVHRSAGNPGGNRGPTG